MPQINEDAIFKQIFDDDNSALRRLDNQEKYHLRKLFTKPEFIKTTDGEFLEIIDAPSIVYPDGRMILHDGTMASIESEGE